MKYLIILFIFLSISATYCQEIPESTFLNRGGDSITLYPGDSIYYHRINLKGYNNTLMGKWKLQHDTIHFKEVIDYNLLRLYNSSFSNNKNRDSIIKARLKEIDQIKSNNSRTRSIKSMVYKNDTLILRTAENEKIEWFLKDHK